jgi:hypothetical protein
MSATRVIYPLAAHRLPSAAGTSRGPLVRTIDAVIQTLTGFRSLVSDAAEGRVLARLDARTLGDIYGDDAPRPEPDHLRDAFGRAIP